MKIRVINGQDYLTLKGRKEYILDVQDGDARLFYDFRSDKPCTMYLVAGEKLIPWASGTHGFGVYHISKLNAVMFVAPEKDTTIAVHIERQERNLTDQINLEKREVPVLLDPKVNLAQLVARMIGEKLGHSAADHILDLEDELDELPTDVDEEYGPGYMELDDYADRVKSRRNTRKSPRVLPDNKSKPPDDPTLPVAKQTSDDPPKEE